MFKKIFLCVALASPMVGLPAPAVAEDVCDQRDAIVIKLTEMYDETHVASGLESAAKMVEIWTSSNGSWTILVTRASGISCVVASGNNWLELKPTDLALGTAS